jgi:DNA polymerase-3 subunit delta'
LIPFNIATFQPRAWSILTRSFVSGRIAGTYLLHGGDGCGHWAMAISLAALLNCESNPGSDTSDGPILPCGECRNCRKIFGLNHEGLYFAVPLPPHKGADEEIELINEILQLKREEPFRTPSSTSSTNIPISVAREIKKSLSRMPGEGITRVVLFYRMDLMKTASADALLKLIEEPPRDTVIILTASRPEALLPTIQSRSQKIKLERIPEQAAVDYLVEKHKVSEGRARLLARISEGSLGHAIDMTDQDEGTDTSSRAVGFFLFKSLVWQDGAQMAAHINEMLNPRDRGEAEGILNLWQSLIRDCASLAISGSDEDIINTDFAADIRKMAVRFANPEVALRMADGIKITLADLRRNVHIQGALTSLALKLKSAMKVA